MSGFEGGLRERYGYRAQYGNHVLPSLCDALVCSGLVQQEGLRMSVDTLSDLCRDLLYRTPVVVVVVALSEFKKGGSRGGKDTLRCDSVAALEMKVMLATTSAEWAQGGPESPALCTREDCCALSASALHLTSHNACYMSQSTLPLATTV
jgi:hypothetical protein